MWNIASHAGTGLAVAGLSATYYALARKTYQLEKESALSSSVGQDSGDASVLSTKISPSQLLLKKELHLRSRNSGHVIGLNVVSSPVHLQPKSNFTNNLRHIKSRFENVNFTNTEEEPQEKDAKTVQPSKTNPFVEESSESINVFAVEEFSSLEFSEDSQARPSTNPSPSPPDKEKLSQDATTEKSVAKNISTDDRKEEKFPIHKTESPIVFYKNPEFTNDDEQQSSVTLQSQNTPGDEKFKQEMTDDIRSYNLKLTKPRKLWSPVPNPQQEVVQKPEDRVTNSSKSLPDLTSHEKCQESNDTKLEESLDEFVSCCSQKVEDVPSTGDRNHLQSDRLKDYNKINWNPTSSFLQRTSTFCCEHFQPPVDLTSFVALSYEDSYKLVVLICCLVVILAGFLGRFIGKGFDWFVEMQSDIETDDNPEAILEH